MLESAEQNSLGMLAVGKDRKVYYLCAAALAIAAVLGFFRPILLDDAYITFRAAANFADGNGLVFNPGERVLSTTAPGYALILGAMTWMGMDTVIAAKILCVIGLLASSFGLWKVFASMGVGAVGYIAGIILCFFPDMITSWGNECSLLMGCFVLGWLAQTMGRPVLCAMIIGLGCMIRPDFALVAMIWLFVWLSSSRRDAMIYTGCGAALAVIWMIFMTTQMGTALPHTMAAKRVQGEWITSGDPRMISGWLTFAEGADFFLRRIILDQVSGLIMFCGFFVMTRLRGSWPMIVWAAAHLAAYYFLNVPGHFIWYYYPLWLVCAISAGVMIDALRRFSKDAMASGQRTTAIGVPLCIGLTLFCALSLRQISDDRSAINKYNAYALMSEKIRNFVPAGSSIMMNEIGQMGYMGARRIVDTHLLIHELNPAEIDATLLNSARIIEKYMPDYLVVEGWLRIEGEEFARLVREGKLTRRAKLSDGRIVEYEQVAYVNVPPHYMPVLLKRKVNEAQIQ